MEEAGQSKGERFIPIRRYKESGAQQRTRQTVIHTPGSKQAQECDVKSSKRVVRLHLTAVNMGVCLFWDAKRAGEPREWN